jgi:hypothetical protein
MQSFGMSAREFGQNVMDNTILRTPVDNPKSPEDLALDVVSDENPTIESVLKCKKEKKGNEKRELKDK